MHMFSNTRRGFTLIELLVVVLIIGILAAVAVPQYQKAVYKSRVIEALAVLPALTNAYNVYYLTTGEHSNDISKFDIDIPIHTSATKWAGVNEEDPDHYYFSCSKTTVSCIGNAANKNLPMLQWDITHNRHTCSIYGEKSTIAEQICKSLGPSEGSTEGYYQLN